ncbi:Kef-type potassium/proton antiporter accessory protein, CPA2 family [Shewanella psychrophila]|uniref:Kef-type potassium/proton antiporter accessory protein, CPA2 family n=1 Tax=Shewanella psychrophila TaxID=225848 RepID=A0A1S6HUJ2_9GAMM|nr:NAD(P)H-dependent oxidoreductase [Shewanella psychrophila]AQS39152.1 Kef-type potassium/proton antiporter accessory protein, CPA2 family [Shewanella psychrophila]
MPEEIKKILVLFAHPSQERSEVNKLLFKASQEHSDVTTIDLYREYPTFHINIDREQQRLLDHDVIIFLFPLHWYSTPAILKQWQDLVLEYGFAYGAGGTALKGKTFFCATTAGGNEKAYQDDGYNHFTIRELLCPIEQTANLTGMHYLAPFVLFSSRNANEEGRIPGHIDTFNTLLTSLAANTLDLSHAASLPVLNQAFTQETQETH